MWARAERPRDRYRYGRGAEDRRARGCDLAGFSELSAAAEAGLVEMLCSDRVRDDAPDQPDDVDKISVRPCRIAEGGLRPIVSVGENAREERRDPCSAPPSLPQPCWSPAPALADAQPVGDRVEVNGMQMYYEVSGEGDPLIVLHGAYMNIPSMGAIIPKLAETHKVYALEFQGHGRTTDIDRPITYPNLADDVAAFMDAVGLEKADVFGYSMGAAAGLQLAIRHPEKVNKLVAASVAYDVEGWQPEFKAFIPQMTVEMFVGMPFAEEYRKLAANPDGFPALVEKLIALEKEPMAWEADVKAHEDPGADHHRRRRRGDARAFGRDVPAARRRRHGRHGQAAAGLAPRRPAGDVAHRRHHPARPAASPSSSRS